MVLFYAGRLTELRNVLAYRYSHYRNDDCVLLAASNWFAKTFPEWPCLVTEGIFSRVIFCSAVTGRNLPTETQVEKAIIDEFDKVFEAANVDISDFQVIINTSDCDSNLGVYLSVKGIRYYFLETATDTFYKCETMRVPSELKRPYLNVIQIHDAFSGKSPLCTPILNEDSEFSKHMLANKTFLLRNTPKQIAMITAQDKHKIRQAFGYAFSPLEVKSVLFILQSSAMLKVEYERNEEMRKQYPRNKWAEIVAYSCQLIVDYYSSSDDAVFIKQHPAGRRNPALFASHFPYATEFSVLPFEFLGEALNGYEFDKIVSFKEYAGGSLNGIGKCVTGIGRTYWNVFLKYNKLYCILKFLEAAKYSGGVLVYGVESAALQIMKNVLFEQLSVEFFKAEGCSQSAYAIIADKLTNGVKERISNSNRIITCFFLNAELSEIRAATGKSHTINKLAILKERNRDKIQDLLGDEYIYAISNDADV
ncbi:MAG: hypothetical protein LBB94_11215, partial [Clostridiales bacterium]|nr:hypothetical protein [Clostridiales bacterium]